MLNNKIKDLIEEFIKHIGIKYRVYNEASLQFELAKFLQEELDSDENTKEKYLVEVERNIEQFGFKKNIKKESDIVIFKNPDDEKMEPLESLKDENDYLEKVNELYFIEVKFPRNNSCSRRMPKFLEDIEFCQKMKNEHGKVHGAFSLVIIDNSEDCKGFYQIKNNRFDSEQPYCFFRLGKKNEPICNYKEGFKEKSKIEWHQTTKIHYYIWSTEN